MIDTHCHLDDERLIENAETIIAGFKENNIEKAVNIGVNLPTSEKSVWLASNYERIYAAVGFHPIDASDYDQAARSKLSELSKHNKCIAIGEIGLDYHYDIPKNLQKDVFIDQLQLADECGLPVVVHIRDAYGDAIEILKEHKSLIHKGGVIHCYSGSVESAAIFVKMGFHIAFGGAVTFTNNKTSEPVIMSLPLDKILIETDCPYLCPMPHRGKLNEPKNVFYVLKKIAEIKKISLEEADRITTENAGKVFTKFSYGD